MKKPHDRISILPIALAVVALAVAPECQLPTGSTTPTSSTSSTTSTPPDTPYYLYATDSAGPGVYAFAIDPATGALTAVSGSPFPDTTSIIDTQAIAADPSGTHLYVASQSTDDVWVFKINSTNGALAFLGQRVATGLSPTVAAVDPTGKFLYVANSGSDAANPNHLSEYAIDAADGELSGIGSLWPAGTSPFAMAFAPSGQLLYASDSAASGSGSIGIFEIDSATGELGDVTNTLFTASSSPSYPLGLAETPNGDYLYTMQSSGAIFRFTIGSDGSLGDALSSGSSFSAAMNAPIDLCVDRSGSFLYVANSGNDDVVATTINPGDGSLALLNPNWSFSTGSSTAPWAIAIDPSGKYLYTANSGNGTISGFSIGNDGALTKIDSSPFAAGVSPTSLTTVKVR